MTDGSFIETINSFFGGALTTLIGAFTGRLMYHSGEVKLGRRRFFGKELLWEIPVAIGMAIIGEAVATYLGLTQPVIGIILAWIVLGEEPTWLLWVGGVLVMFGALLAQKRTTPEPPQS